MLGIECPSGTFEGVTVVGEVIHLLRHVREKDLEAFVEGGAVVLVFSPRRGGRPRTTLAGAFFVAGPGIAQRGHIHPSIHPSGPMSMWWPSMECMACALLSESMPGISFMRTYRVRTFQAWVASSAGLVPRRCRLRGRKKEKTAGRRAVEIGLRMKSHVWFLFYKHVVEGSCCGGGL